MGSAAGQYNGNYTTAGLYNGKCSWALQREVQPGFQEELHYSRTVQEKVQPLGCTRESAAGLYNGKCSRAVHEELIKCSQAVQGEVQPGCTRGSAARL